MPDLSSLISAAGTWKATYELRDPENKLSQDSESTARVTPVIDGKFVRIDYTWAFRGAPQEGSLLVGCEDGGVVTVVWTDGFHNGHRMMVCTGHLEADGSLDVMGSYPAPPGPDWGWRTRILAGADSLVMEMFNVFPGGEREDIAVRCSYRRG